MNRREFSLQLAGVAGAAALASLGLPNLAFAAPGTPVEGKDYNKLKTPLPVNKDGKIEVIEFFWYACPHCYAFEPVIEPWAATVPADVRFHRVPVAFDALKEVHQQIYYTWEALGLVEQMHGKTFKRFHIDHKPINKEADMLDFAKESGLDVDKVKAAWNSFSVASKMRGAKQLSEDYDIDGVPEIGIQGRFTTAPSMGGPLNAIATTEYLLNVIRKGG